MDQKNDQRLVSNEQMQRLAAMQRQAKDVKRTLYRYQRESSEARAVSKDKVELKNLEKEIKTI